MISLALSVNVNKSVLNAGKLIDCCCVVRNLENGQRRVDQVVYSENEDGSRGVPYSPQVFPSGIWTVGAPREIDLAHDVNHYLWPYFIPTDAWQLVDEWGTDQTDRLHYTQKTGHQKGDWGYGLHFSQSATTLGCIKILDESNLRWLVRQIIDARVAGDVQLTVA
jgi:hypothetical protein